MFRKKALKRRSITKKIVVLLIHMVLTSLLLLGAVGIWSLYLMRDISVSSGRQLGQTAADDAEAGLEHMAGEQLLLTAVEKSAYIEEKFKEVSAYVNGIAQAAEEIYKNPEGYPDRDVALPQRNSTKLAAQLLWSESLKYPTKKQKAELNKLANIQDLLVQYNANNDMVSSTYIATASGWFIQADYIARSKYSEGMTMPDYFEAKERQWYQRALLTEPGEIVYSDVIKDVHSGETCIVCARQVCVDGRVVAVAGVGSYLNTVKEAVLNTVIGENGYAFLVDKNGQVILSPKQSGEVSVNEGTGDLRKSKNEALAQAAKSALQGEEGVVRLTIDEREVYLAYAPLENLGWSFMTVMDVEEVLAPAVAGQNRILALSAETEKQQNYAIRRTILTFLAIMLLAAAVINMVGVVFAAKLTKPLRKLTKDVKKMDGGCLDYRTNILTGDEIEDLGNAFNDMTAQIQAYVANIREVTAEKERIHAELSVATGIQADMLPETERLFADRRDFYIHAVMCPAKEVGGDFYDCFLIDEEHLAFLVADVSGKGVPAALFMVVAKTLIENRCMTGETPAEVFYEVNNALCRNNRNGMFLTAWFGILDLSTGVLTYVNAGHNSPLFYSWDEEDKVVKYRYLKDRTGFILAGMEDSEYRQKEIQLRRGDKLFLYSDGVTEANNETSELYGDDRLEKYLNDHKTMEPKALCKSLWLELKDFQGKAPQFDDITMLSLEYVGQKRDRKVEFEWKENKGTADISRQPQVMDFVGQELAANKVPEQKIVRLLTAVDEIYSNICFYSNAKKVIVKCAVEDGKAVICFLDDGIPYNPLEREAPDVEAPMEERTVGGLGIHLVQKMMDIVTYEYKDGKNQLTVQMTVKKRRNHNGITVKTISPSEREK